MRKHYFWKGLRRALDYSMLLCLLWSVLGNKFQDEIVGEMMWTIYSTQQTGVCHSGLFDHSLVAVTRTNHSSGCRSMWLPNATWSRSLKALVVKVFQICWFEQLVCFHQKAICLLMKTDQLSIKQMAFCLQRILRVHWNSGSQLLLSLWIFRTKVCLNYVTNFCLYQKNRFDFILVKLLSYTTVSPF